MCHKIVNIMFAFIVFSVLTHSVVGQYECENLKDMPQRNVTVKDSYIGIIESLEIYDIQDASVVNSPYIDVYVENASLTVRTTPDFADYENADNFLVTISVDCTEGTYTLNYNIEVEESSCVIEFEQPNYSYTFYDALPSSDDFDIPELEKFVVNCAINPVNFSIEENEYFYIEYGGINNDSNQYYGKLKVLQNIYGKFDKTFDIRASDDNENPNRTAIATLRVEVIDTNNLAFTRSSYYGYIKTNLDIVIENGPITFANSDTNLDEVEIEMSPEYGLFFEVQVSTEVNLVVGSQANLKDLANYEDYIVILLTAYGSDNFAETSIMLNMTLLSENDYVIDEDSPTTSTPFEIDDFSYSTNSPPDDDVLEISEQNITLRRFDSWISSIKAFVVMIVIITITLILSTIIYIRVRRSTARRRTLFYNSQ